MATLALGRPIGGVATPDEWYLKGWSTTAAVEAALVGRSFAEARRIGKLLLLDVAGGPTLGLRFGMTGRLVVDGAAGIDELVYASVRDEPRWDRFEVRFEDGGGLAVRDPRRLGGVYLDPDEAVLGVDALAVTPSGLRRALAGSRAPLKARLMDQSRLAGIGNLAADEILFRAGLDPARPAGSLTAVELRRLHRHVVRTLADLVAGGGSHTGVLQPSRIEGGRCPRDGAPLVRRTIGGRTSWSCPRHQA